MKPIERLTNWKLHDSMRGQFGFELYKEMMENKDIFLLMGDLGYKLFDAHKEDFPERVINCGASEQSMLDIACGLAMSGKIPVVYSITSFLLYRPFETLRTYIDYEKIPVKLVGGGRDKDYAHDGISHWSEDAKKLLDTMTPNIKQYWPNEKQNIEPLMKKFLYSKEPSFLSLKR